MIDPRNKTEIKKRAMKIIETGYEKIWDEDNQNQIIDGAWYGPKFGCDSLDQITDEITELIIELENAIEKIEILQEKSRAEVVRASR